MSTSLEALGWGTGWPHCHPEKLVSVQLSSGLRLPVRREIATLVGWLCAETERRGYDIKPGETWTYACRPIRGSSSPSRHSWGCALDINAPENPMLQGRLVSDMPEWLPGLWKSHGFGWGGDYGPNHWDGRKWVGSGPHRYDAMHLEVVVSPAEIARITAQLGTPVPPSGGFLMALSDAEQKEVLANSRKAAADAFAAKVLAQGALDQLMSNGTGGDKKGPYLPRLRDGIAEVQAQG